MLDTLLESKSPPRRDRKAAIISAGLHTALILAAGYATASGASPRIVVDDATHLHYIIPSPQDPTTNPRALPGRRPSRGLLWIPRPVPPRVDVPVDVPSIDLTGNSVEPTDFGSGAPLSSGDPGAAHNGAGGSGGTVAYDASQVDSPVSMQGTFRPDYPAQLRAAGVEGQVVVQFVVTESGRVDPRSVRIVSASNDLFAAAVTNALSRMRFTAARIGQRAVPQLVQQQFLFRLDR